MTRQVSILFFIITFFSSSFLTSVIAASDNDLTVYSTRKEHLIKPLFDAFTEKTGIKVSYLTGKGGALIERIKLGGKVTCIDLSTEKDSWDIVPDCHHNWNIKGRNHMNNLKKVQNAFWYTYKALNFKAKVIYSHINNLPVNIGIYDVSLMSLVLLHL